jgi:hypothetical protein
MSQHCRCLLNIARFSLSLFFPRGRGGGREGGGEGVGGVVGGGGGEDVG